MPVKLFAVSDLHGCLVQAERAMARAGLIDTNGDWIAEDTKLVVLGDSIDRGPDSFGMVLKLLQWKAQASHLGSELKLLMGNHEYMVLTAHRNQDSASDWWTHGGRECLKSYGIEFGHFYTTRYSHAVVQATPAYFLELESYYLDADTEILFVHGGVHHQQTLAHLDKSVIHLWLRPQDFLPYLTPEILRANYGAKQVVFGHTPVLDGPTLYNNKLALCIDTGSFIKNRGRVTVVEMTSGTVQVAGMS